MSNVKVIPAKRTYHKLSDIKYISNDDDFWEAVRLMQKEYCLINRNGQTYVLGEDKRNGEPVYTALEHFSKFYKYLHIKVPVVNTTRTTTEYVVESFYMSHKTKRLHGIIFDPREKPGIGEEYYNLWKGWKYEPIEGPVDFFLHLVNVNCSHNKELSEYMLNYFAHAIQYPYKQPMTSLVIRGEQGTGKGTLIVDTILALSNNSKHLNDLSQMVGDFNGYMADSFFVCMDECSFGGNIKEANKLKTFISEKSRIINDKMKTAYKVDAYSRSFILSNNDFIVNVEASDRRYIISECSSELKGNREFFRMYQEWLNDMGGYNAIMYYLLNRDISNFNTLQLVETQQKRELQLKSSDLSVKYLISWLQCDFKLPEEICEFNNVSRPGMYNHFIDWCKTYHPKAYTPTNTEFGKTIAQAFKFELDNVNWKSNWKKSNSYYYYKMKREHVLMEMLARNLFKCNAEDLFFNYEETKRKNEAIQ